MCDISAAVRIGVKSIQEQGDQISSLAKRLSVSKGFVDALTLLATRKIPHGRVIISAIGKSGHVGRKIAATLSSTGTTSSFIHSTEAFHGDLGMITPYDVVILISNSGETNEVINLMPILKRWGNKIISISGNPESTLAVHADANIDVSVAREVCPNNLAPTSSTTATMVVGDALACGLMRHENFVAKDFARYHPGGALGRRMLNTVKDKQWDYSRVPVVSRGDNLMTVAIAMTEKRSGLVFVKDLNDNLEGIITDGDLRRGVAIEGELGLAESVMTESPIIIPSSTTLADALVVMTENKINCLVVESEDGTQSVVEQVDVV